MDGTLNLFAYLQSISRNFCCVPIVFTFLMFKNLSNLTPDPSISTFPGTRIRLCVKYLFNSWSFLFPEHSGYRTISVSTHGSDAEVRLWDLTVSGVRDSDLYSYSTGFTYYGRDDKDLEDFSLNTFIHLPFIYTRKGLWKRNSVIEDNINLDSYITI